MHLVLLGDSIFDNQRYTEGGPDVLAQVKQLLPAGWRASLLAVDGSTTQDVLAQVKRLPSDASHLVLSVGGNDALMNADVLRTVVKWSADVIDQLADIAQGFETDYRRAVGACHEVGLPLSICAIYNGCFPDKEYQRRISTALTIFNDVILRVAIDFGLSVIDLRLICDSDLDYANPIEPNSTGGAKIARSIVNLVTGTVAGDAGMRVFVR